MRGSVLRRPRPSLFQFHRNLTRHTFSLQSLARPSSKETLWCCWAADSPLTSRQPSSRMDGVIGTGYEVVTHSLSIGRHKITLNFPDGLEGEALASVFVYIMGEN